MDQSACLRILNFRKKSFKGSSRRFISQLNQVVWWREREWVRARLSRPELVHLKESGAFFSRLELSEGSWMSLPATAELWDSHSLQLSCD